MNSFYKSKIFAVVFFVAVVFGVVFKNQINTFFSAFWPQTIEKPAENEPSDEKKQINPENQPKKPPVKPETEKKPVKIKKTIPMAKEAMLAGQSAKAVAILQEVLEESPQEAEAYLLLIELFLQKGQTAAARQKFRLAEGVLKDQGLLLTQDVKILLYEEKWTEALAKMRESDEKSGELRFYEAFLHMMVNDHAQAQAVLTDLEKNNDPNVALREQLAKTATGILKTYEDFEAIIEGKDPHLYATLAKQLVVFGQPYLASALATEALLEEKEYADAWVVRGYAFLQLGRSADAVYDLLEAYKLNENRAETLFLLATAYTKQEKPKKAIDFFELSLEKGFPEKKVVLQTLLGLYNAQKDAAKFQFTQKRLEGL